MLPSLAISGLANLFCRCRLGFLVDPTTHSWTAQASPSGYVSVGSSGFRSRLAANHFGARESKRNNSCSTKGLVYSMSIMDMIQ